MLAHPAKQAQLILVTDASDTAMGAALEQIIDGRRQPLGFYSKKFTATQTRYSAYNRELLAIYSAVHHFQCMIEGRNVVIYTDHKPLVYAFEQRPEKASPRLRHLDFISQFRTNIHHLAGTENNVADALSRINDITTPVIITTDDIAANQRTDEELKNLLQNPGTLNLKQLRVDNTETTIYCDVSTENIRPYIPKPLRRRIFDVVYNTVHLSGKTTRRQISTKFVWSSMNKDIMHWARTCLQCQRTKIGRHVRRRPEQIHVPDERFSHIHMDIVGPLPPSRGQRYCLAMIDRFTRWPEAVPIPDISADTIVDAFFGAWVARFGTLTIITTDRESQFDS